jgi:hypothetical protein
VAARPSYNSPQAMRAKQAAMEVLRDYGRLGHDAFRQAVAAPPPYARPGYAPGVPLGAAPPGPPGAAPQQRDPGGAPHHKCVGCTPAPLLLHPNGGMRLANCR